MPGSQQKHWQRGLAAGTAGLLTMAGLLLAGSSAHANAPAQRAAASSSCTSPTLGPARIGNIGGLARPTSTHACSPSGAGQPAQGTPPLLFHGGPVMSTPSTGNRVVITPIYWGPAGHTFTSSYKTLLTRYFKDSAAASDTTSNIWSTMFQYSGSNGKINYRFTVGTPINDTNAFPANGCTVSPGPVYADNTGYNACLDDAQLQAEASSVVAARGLPRDFGHIYVLYLPKKVESCVNAGSSTVNNQCTINASPTAAYCAYHSMTAGGLVYANMPFPIYSSATGFSCTDEGLGGGIQAPNGDKDADVEISPASHEVAEAITDPDVSGGWYDSSGFENGDECAYTYGPLGGAAGAHFNQTINGHVYLTQEEFSNRDFNATGGGCLQSEPQPAPSLTKVTPASGTHLGGTSVVVTGTNFAGATAVTFGGTPATSFTVNTNGKITAISPAHAVGTVDVRVTTSTGTTVIKLADHYTFN